MNNSFSWIFGIIIGFTGGCIVRDNYIFTYSQKISILHQDYLKMRTSVQQRIQKQQQNVNKLKYQYKLFQQLYLHRKEEEFRNTGNQKQNSIKKVQSHTVQTNKKQEVKKDQHNKDIQKQGKTKNQRKKWLGII